MHGGMLTARCNGPQGLVRSTIDPRTCRGGDIANVNGQLTCNGGYRGGRYGHGYGYGNGSNNGGYNNGNGSNNGGYNNGGYDNGNGRYAAAAAGSYQQSCTNVSMNGGTLTATCPGQHGSLTTSINPRSCRGGDIANVNGRLECR